MAQTVRLVVAAVAGIVVGYYFGPQAGVATFSAVYGVSGLFAPGQKVYGGKLADLKAPTAAYGSTIPYLRGTPRLGGIVVWCSDKRQVTHTEEIGGKGGGGTTSETYTYEIDMLIEIAINSCLGVRRAWKNGKLIWTRAEVSDGSSLAASQATDEWRDIRFYDGNPDQLPDPVYEAAIGIGRAPAYRSRTTIFIEGANLGQSGQLPIYTFEVVGPEGGSAFVEAAASDALTSGGGFIPGPASFNPLGYALHVPQWDFGYATDLVNVFEMTTSPPSQVAQYHIQHVSSVASCAVMSGPSDVSCLVLSDRALSQTDVKLYELPSTPDTPSIRTFIVTGGAYLDKVCRLGDDIVFGSNLSGSTTSVYRCNIVGGYPVATSPTLGSRHHALAITTDGYCWVLLGAGPTGLKKLDLATMSVVATMSAVEDGVLLGDGDDLYLRSSYNFYRLDGATWTLLNTLAITTKMNTGVNIGMFRGVLYSIFQDPAATPNNVFQTYGLFPTLPANAARLDVVVRDLCLRTGQLTDADIDVTQLASDYVRALFISQNSPTRTTLETLSGSFFFECVEGQVLKFVKRGQTAAATIPYADLGTSDEGDGEPTAIKRLNNLELPAIIVLKYANMAADFQDGAESSDRLTTDSTTVENLEVPIGFLPSEAKKIADVAAMDLATSIQQVGPISVPLWKYPRLEDTDVVNVTDQVGNQIRARISRTSDDGATLTFDLIVDDATVINSTLVSDDSYSSSYLVRSVSNTTTTLLDIPPLRDDDTDDVGFYAAPSSAGSWPGAELDRSLDGTSYTKVATLTTKAIVGKTVTAQGNFTFGNVFDNRSVVRVDVGLGNTLSNASKTDLLTTSANAALFGDEIEQFAVATMVSDGVYDLSCFRRALRGTERATGTHAVGERFVLLNKNAIRRVADTTTDLNRAVFYKSPTFGKSQAAAVAQSFTNTGVSLKPFAPVDFHLDRGLSPTVLSWHRRSRLSSRFLQAGVEPSLGETTEAYEVDVFSPAMALVTTLQTDEPQVDLSAWLATTTLSNVIGYRTPIVSGSTLVICTVQTGDPARVPPTAFSNYGTIGAFDSTLYTLLYAGEVFDMRKTISAFGDTLVTLYDFDGTYLYVLAQAASSYKLFRYPISELGVARFALPPNSHEAYFDQSFAQSGGSASITWFVRVGSVIWACGYARLWKLAADLSVTQTVDTGALVSTPIPPTGQVFYESSTTHLWVLDRNNNCVLEFTSGGTVSLVGSTTLPGGAVNAHLHYGRLYVLTVSSTVGTMLTIIDTSTSAIVRQVSFTTAGQSLNEGLVTISSTRLAASRTDGTVLIIDNDGNVVQSFPLANAFIGGPLGSGVLISSSNPDTGIARAQIFQEVPYSSGYTAKVYQMSSVVGRGFPSQSIPLG